MYYPLRPPASTADPLLLSPPALPQLPMLVLSMHVVDRTVQPWDLQLAAPLNLVLAYVPTTLPPCTTFGWVVHSASLGHSPMEVEPRGLDREGSFIASRSDLIDTLPNRYRHVPRHSSSSEARNARRHRDWRLLRRRRSAEEANRKHRRRFTRRNARRKPRTKRNVRLRLVS